MDSKVLKVKKLRNNEYYDIQSEYDKLYQKSKDNSNFNNLMNLICDERNIRLAYRNLKNNKGSMTAGYDGLTIDHYNKWSNEKFVKIIKEKLNNYKPNKVKRVEIPKPNGKKRPLGIPCMIDRIIQQCILQVIEPICEAKFHKHSYGFRPNRSCEHALARCQSLINKSNFHYVVDVDIKGFFDNINHGKLLKQIYSLGIRDKNLLKIISKMLKSEVIGEGIKCKGTPQGGIISPILSNIVLNELDWWVSDQWETFKTVKNYERIRVDKGKTPRIDRSDKYDVLRRKSNLKEMFIVRYADDFKIFCKDYKSATKIFASVKKWLKLRLSLEISEEKSKITNLRKGKTEFLGFNLKGYWKADKKKYVCHSHMSEKSIENVTKKLIKQIKVIKKELSIKNISRLNSIILGSHNYYKNATHIAQDMCRINYRFLVVFKNRLKKYYKENGIPSVSYKKLYGNYKGNIHTIKGICIYPVYGCKTKNSRSFKQVICNYTKEGREFKHKNGFGLNTYVKYILNNSKYDSVELSDNKIALIYGQRGACYITKLPLEIADMECHHKIPRSLGGKDNYKNLVWLNKDIHKLIHATNLETIEKYKDKFELDKKAIVKVNTLRHLAGNLDI